MMNIQSPSHLLTVLYIYDIAYFLVISLVGFIFFACHKIIINLIVLIIHFVKNVSLFYFMKSYITSTQQIMKKANVIINAIIKPETKMKKANEKQT